MILEWPDFAIGDWSSLLTSYERVAPTAEADDVPRNVIRFGRRGNRKVWRP